jgi:hypothetical protein
LEAQKSTTNQEKNDKIKALKKSLQLAELRFELLSQKEKFIIIPVKDGFETINNKDKNPLTNLVLILSQQGLITKGNIIQFIAEPGKSRSIPENSFSKIFNYQKLDCDGQFAVLSLSDRLLYQMKYEDGSLRSVGVAEPKKHPTAANGPDPDPIGPAPICTDWYLVTTYYYLDGTTEQTEQYLYTTCESSSGGGGGSGDGSDNIEYEYEAVKEMLWVVYSFPGSVYSVNSLERIKGKKVIGRTTGGYFTGIAHSADGCNAPSGVWVATDWKPQYTLTSASNWIKGRYTDGTVTNIEGSISWSFSEVFQ